MTDYISPFAPKFFPPMTKIDGMKIYTCCSQIRYKNRDDLLLVVFDDYANVAGVYTRSSMPSAPVDFCKIAHNNNKKAKILCVNAGNANAFTGKAGLNTVQNVSNILSKKFNCDPYEIYQASTGVIGEKLDGIALGKAAASITLESQWEHAAKAIMTTDTFAKGASRNVTLSNGKVISISGIAKGSGMIAPNMGTMLAFIFTDAALDQKTMQSFLPSLADKSFNSITVDGDTSTSDTLQLFATGQGEMLSGPDLEIVKSSLSEICEELALMIVKDGEGITKFININVSGAEDDDAARKIGLSIANSPLVKTAIAGEDANWGRVVAAIGKSGEKANRDQTSISFGGITIAENGEALEGYDEAPVAQHMKHHSIEIKVDVGISTGNASVYTTDLTHRYIEINADYRS